MSWWQENLSNDAMETALHRAMTKAGCDPTRVSLDAWTDCTDAYADYTGVRVVTEDVDMRERAIKFLRAYITLRMPEARRRGTQARCDVRGEDVIVMARWSIGD